MIKQDEKNLFRFVHLSGCTPRRVAQVLGIHPKRCRYICGKWADKGIYDYGVSVDMGWLEPFGA